MGLGLTAVAKTDDVKTKTKTDEKHTNDKSETIQKLLQQVKVELKSHAKGSSWCFEFDSQLGFSFIEFGTRMKIPLLKEGKLHDVLQLTIHNIQLAKPLQKQGILKRIVEFLLMEHDCDAVQIEAVQNRGLHETLIRSKSSFGIWHKQSLPSAWLDEPELGHSFVRFR